jgi:hypothetical protein
MIPPPKTIKSGQTVADLFDDIDEFETLLSDAEAGADSDWETDFVDDLRNRYDEHGERMYLSERQLEILERIAG